MAPLVATAAACAALGCAWGGVGICILSPPRRKPPIRLFAEAIAGWTPPARGSVLGTVNACIGQQASANNRTALLLASIVIYGLLGWIIYLTSSSGSIFYRAQLFHEQGRAEICDVSSGKS
jgi:hypothetical protein